MTSTLWNKDFVLLIIANAFASFGFQILWPTLPIFLTEHGSTSSQTGLIMGIFTLSAIIIRLFSAYGERRLGAKKFLYLGLSICCLSIAAYNLGTSFISAFSVRILHGLGFGITTTLLATLAIYVIPATRRGEGIGYLGFGMILTSSIAPFWGIWLLDNINSLALFLFAAFTQLLALLCIVSVKISNFSSNTSNNNKSNSFFNTIIEKDSLFPSFLALLLGICSSSILSFITLFAIEKNIFNVGYVFLAMTGGTFFARIVCGRIFDRKGHPFVLIPASLICIISLFNISQALSLTDLIIAAFLYGLSTGSIFPTLQAWIMNRAKPERRTEANAMFYNSFDLGIGGGSALLGFIVSITNYATMYLFATFIMVLLSTIYILYLIYNKQKA